MTMQPASLPQASFTDISRLAFAAGLDPEREPLFVVGVRGYYRDTMGIVGRNDRGVYDDAMFLKAGTAFRPFNGNTDPSRVRKGRGTGAGKGMAVLKPGLYRAHRLGLHRGKYEALCQLAGQVTVIRDGDPPYPDTGFFGINIHRGGYGTTSSEGCQTLPPSQWEAFIGAVRAQAKRINPANYRAVTVPYLLVEGPIR